MQVYFVYMTARDEAEALVIGRTLVEERLAACINILPAMTSVYWWEGELEQSSEAVLIAKTQQGLVPELIERVKRLHSYACPSIVAWPVPAGHQPFRRQRIIVMGDAEFAGGGDLVVVPSLPGMRTAQIEHRFDAVGPGRRADFGFA